MIFKNLQKGILLGTILSVGSFFILGSSPEVISEPIEKIKIDSDFNLHDNEKYHPPYVIKSTINGNTLSLLATQHDKNINSDVFKTIKALINSSIYDRIIVEGYRPNQTIDQENITRCENLNFQGCSEFEYAISLANKLNIEIGGAEPTFQETWDILKEAPYNYGTQDYLSYLYARDFPKFHNQKEITEGLKGIQKQIERDSNIETVTGYDHNFTYQEFQDWYNNKVEAFDVQKVNGTPNKHGNYLQIISWNYNNIRNEKLKEIIDNNLNKNTLVIYGENHIDSIYKYYIDQATESEYLRYYKDW